ncbi:hypothetical protein DVS28_b0092 (plasmid) [Euzebya pacifica]|uniref:Uncharacterized protein n=1 Tax=Euzebya pacifica TaxID=1608957 RepID=A0A346Y5W5_9ACTN|nr:hypothetical protein [Euzebya pacifica]AXV09862.1 hypothetical protein DVS28_b0092 [Euzebya pacifica]
MATLTVTVPAYVLVEIDVLFADDESFTDAVEAAVDEAGLPRTVMVEPGDWYVHPGSNDTTDGLPDHRIA